MNKASLSVDGVASPWPALKYEQQIWTPSTSWGLRATEAGILKRKDEHRLGPFWRSDEVLHAIDAFAERAGRRSA